MIVSAAAKLLQEAHDHLEAGAKEVADLTLRFATTTALVDIAESLHSIDVQRSISHPQRPAPPSPLHR